jgi:two-component system sensor histidine kinase HydH
VTERVPGTFVLADADQLRQVVWNLCLNAIQAMPNGGRLTVTIEPERSDRPPEPQPTHGHPDESASVEWVEIAFRDTGRGISPEGLGRLFDPFFTTRPSGTGLGLVIARKILESMGGTIEVESQIDIGSTFRIRLRRAKAVAAVS